MIPQGSCLGGLLLFIIYASKLFKVIEDQLPDAHGYADDGYVSPQQSIRIMDYKLQKCPLTYLLNEHLVDIIS